MKHIFFIAVFAVVLIACSSKNENNKPVYSDPIDSGTLNVTADESFKPVVDEQVKMFQVYYPKIKINLKYKSEADCFKDFINDSTRLIIVSRGLTKNESEFFFNKLSFKPTYAQLAYDAVAAIINIDNPDSVYTFQKIKNILSGKEKYTTIADGTNATSTVRFLKDSILKGVSFGTNVQAVKGADSVIELIKQKKDAIGFVSNCWVSNGYDDKQLKNLKQMKLALVECTRCEEKGYFAKASQATLQRGQYPFARPVFYIVKENMQGIGTKFGNFMSNEKGQLIFRTSCLIPAKMSFNQRQTKL